MEVLSPVPAAVSSTYFFKKTIQTQRKKQEKEL
jgi:hypothetical protein